MRLSEGTLTALVEPDTTYTVISAAATTTYVVKELLPGIFLGPQSAVVDTYVEDGYFSGTKLT